MMTNEVNISLPERQLFEKVYDEYFDKVNQYLRYRVQNTWDADDLTAQVFIKAYEHFAQCRNPEKVGSWIFQIAHNTYVDYLRKKKDHLPLDEQMAVTKEQSQPEQMALISAEIGCLKSCLEQLPQEQRDVLLLRYFGDLKYQHIAEILGKKDATVKTMGFRALGKLRDLFTNRWGGETNGR
ncbi:MAG: RNA polymerase sigma factor [Bacillota bacterium]|nr:RNA polymerase sigma factor [Bacillota bacterium]